VLAVIMLIIAVVGIKITARTQVSMAVVEYAILVGLAIWGLVAVINHHPGTFPITKGWFSPWGIGHKGSVVAGFLIAVFVYGGWDGTLYVNEEVKHRRITAGRSCPASRPAVRRPARHRPARFPWWLPPLPRNRRVLPPGWWP
jgi:amino acid transporter